ncbi:FAS1-like dehydratase domain-containing protein [Pseudomonas vancouverensis]|uniref:FAS1-like dehydratase domain-containing protein n=1 Tax=Pseudomonas vancouverensis TaxID=95300 RepID=UPI003D014551
MSSVDLSAWIGRSEVRRDLISHTLVQRMAATLGEPSPLAGEPLPHLWHWAFFQDAVPQERLGIDGHPERGGFLPPAENRNRMWAGSRLEFYRNLLVGSCVLRVSTITGVEEKHGATGGLLFVTIRHEYFQDGQRALQEEQDIVYREPTPAKLRGTQALPEGQWQEAVEPTPALLFRYSAVTFNGHRIHYDWPYATEVEGYPGLVVHGPLIATLNLRAFTRAHPTAQLQRFSFRGVRPLISPQSFVVGGLQIESGKAEVWAGNDSGVAQLGQIEFSYGEAP